VAYSARTSRGEKGAGVFRDNQRMEKPLNALQNLMWAQSQEKKKGSGGGGLERKRVHKGEKGGRKRGIVDACNVKSSPKVGEDKGTFWYKRYCKVDGQKKANPGSKDTALTGGNFKL